MPTFPAFAVAPTFAQIERAMERLVDLADAAFASGNVAADEYNDWYSGLIRWADAAIAR
jgi:hypothetical protein